jgi:hypothetical protein
VLLENFRTSNFTPFDIYKPLEHVQNLLGVWSPFAPLTKLCGPGKRERIAHTHPTILGVTGHIILTPVNQLMDMGLKIWSLLNPGYQPATFRSLAQRANQLR